MIEVGEDPQRLRRPRGWRDVVTTAAAALGAAMIWVAIVAIVILHRAAANPEPGAWAWWLIGLAFAGPPLGVGAIMVLMTCSLGMHQNNRAAQFASQVGLAGLALAFVYFAGREAWLGGWAGFFIGAGVAACIIGYASWNLFKGAPHA